MSEPKESKQIQYGFAEQTAFATPTADDATYRKPLVEPFDIERDIQNYKTPEQHGSRNMTKRSSINTTAGAMGNFTSKGPMSIFSADFFVYAHTQLVTEGGASGYTKTFNMFATHPVYEDDEGYFLTWMKRYPTASQSHKLGGCISRKLTLSGERGGIVQIENEWVGKGAGSVTANPPTGSSDAWIAAVGASDDEGLVYFGDISAVSVTFGDGSAQSLRLKSFSFSHEYDVEKIGHNGTDFVDFGLHNRRGTFELVTLKDTEAETAFSNHASDDVISISITFTLGSNSVVLTWLGKQEVTPKTTEDGVLGLTLTGGIYADDSSSQPFTITITNSTNRSW